MKMIFLKCKDDKKNYRMLKGFGFDVFEIDSPEQIDSKIEELKKNNYTTIFIPDELASFSEKLTENYKNDNKLNIVITPGKK